jgi:hypothetical protein
VVGVGLVYVAFFTAPTLVGFLVTFVTLAAVVAFGFLVADFLGAFELIVFAGSLALEALALSATFLAAAVLLLVERADGGGLFKKSAAAILMRPSFEGWYT